LHYPRQKKQTIEFNDYVLSILVKKTHIVNHLKFIII